MNCPHKPDPKDPLTQILVDSIKRQTDAFKLRTQRLIHDRQRAYGWRVCFEQARLLCNAHLVDDQLDSILTACPKCQSEFLDPFGKMIDAAEHGKLVCFIRIDGQLVVQEKTP